MNKIKEIYQPYRFSMPEEAFDIPQVTKEFEFLLPADEFSVGEEEVELISNLFDFYVEKLREIKNKTVDFKKVPDVTIIESYIIPYLDSMSKEIGYDGDVDTFVVYNPGLCLSLLVFGLSQV